MQGAHQVLAAPRSLSVTLYDAGQQDAGHENFRFHETVSNPEPRRVHDELEDPYFDV